MIQWEAVLLRASCRNSWLVVASGKRGAEGEADLDAVIACIR